MSQREFQPGDRVYLQAPKGSTVHTAQVQGRTVVTQQRDTGRRTPLGPGLGSLVVLEPTGEPAIYEVVSATTNVYGEPAYNVKSDQSGVAPLAHPEELIPVD